MYEVLKLGRKHNTTSISEPSYLKDKFWGVRPLPNMTILVLSMLTFSFQVKQYSWKASSCACKLLCY
jgi:hypothetical protein